MYFNSTYKIQHTKFFVPVLIFILCFVLYGNTLHNGYAGDDGIVTYKNDFILKGFSAFQEIWDKGSLYGVDKNNATQYRPLILLNFMAETSLLGFNPHVSHFFNVLFYALTVVLLYFLLQKILKNYNHAIITAAVLIFAFHPIHTEVVANIKSRDEILGLLFGLLSFYFLLLHTEKTDLRLTTYDLRLYSLSLITFFAALFCKENCLSFIAIIPLLLYFFTGLKTKGIVLKSLPYLGLVVIYLFIRSRVLQSMTFAAPLTIMQNSLMAASNSADRVAASFVLLGKYIYMTVIPYPLGWDYSYNQIPFVSWRNFKPLLSLIVCLVLMGYMLWRFRKKSIYSFLTAFFFITLLLSSNLIIKIAWTFGERFLYAPSLGFCIALPILTAKALKLNPFQLEWRMKLIFFIPIILLLILYTAIVIPRNAEWKNDFTLFSSGVVTSPNSVRTHSVLASLYKDSAENSVNKAKRLQFFSLSIGEIKKATGLYTQDPDCYNNLGVCYYGLGYQDSAIAPFKRALELNPKYAVVSNNLGIIYSNKGQYDSALTFFFMSYKSDSNTDALINIAETYHKMNYVIAFRYDTLVFKKAPHDRSTLNKLAKLYNAIGMQYAGNDELDKALEKFNASFLCDTNSADALGNIGVIYAKKGNITTAITYFQKALIKNPDNDIFKRNIQVLSEKKK
jgi:tetratricopeptide (TPR) repeat protein